MKRVKCLWKYHERWRWAAVLTICIALAGCASLKEKRRMDELERSLTTYTSALRWGHYEEAAAYRLHPDKAPVSPLDRGAFEGIRIISCEILERLLNEAQTEAVITLSISYYLEDTGIARSITDRQIWWFDQTQERWFLDGDLPRLPR